MVDLWTAIYHKFLKEQRTLYMPKPKRPTNRIPMNITVEGKKNTLPAIVVPQNARLLKPDGVEINKILYVLLHKGTPYGTEYRISNIIRHYAREDGIECSSDKMGNLWFSIGKNEEHHTMFSCHMDTVHKHEEALDLYITTGPNPPDRDYVFAWSKGQRQILGADDKLGCYIMLRMMFARVPGLYVFHVGEERGGIGSKYIVDNNPDLVKDIERCVAFDRMNYGDVINWQRGGTCCSIEFTNALCTALNDTMQHKVFGGHDLKEDKYKFKSASGTFTDSASYTQLIPECTNISVGYFKQHSREETFDLYWLEHCLIPTLLKLEWSKLVTKRDPTYKPTYTSSYYSSYGGYGGHELDENWWNGLDEEGSPKPSRVVPKKSDRPMVSYRTEMPMHIRNDPDYTLYDMLKNPSLLVHKNVYKWSWRYSVDIFDQLKVLFGGIATLRKENEKLQKEIKDFEDDMVEYNNCEDELAETLEIIYEYVEWMKGAGHGHMITGKMEELAERYLDLYTTPGAEEEAKEANEEDKKENVKTSSVTIDRQDGVIKNEIKFNSDTFELTVDGKKAPIYSKKGSCLDPRHFGHLTPGTQLFGHLGNQRVQVHVVTGKEAVTMEAKKRKQPNG